MRISFFCQIKLKGIAMGSIAGPSIANSFVSCLETKWIIINNPLSYVRFMDDIHYIDLDDSKIESLKEAFRDLELNMTTGDSVDFLDINTSINKTTVELIFKPFFKNQTLFLIYFLHLITQLLFSKTYLNLFLLGLGGFVLILMTSVIFL